MIERNTISTWFVRNKLFITGGVAGAIAGYLYWKYIGCLTGTCAITSNPFRSTIYFAVIGGLLFSLFKRKQNGKSVVNDNTSSEISE